MGNLRTCPVCEYAESEYVTGAERITAVYNGKRQTADGLADEGRCQCPVCHSVWDELIFKSGQRVNLVVQNTKQL